MSYFANVALWGAILSLPVIAHGQGSGAVLSDLRPPAAEIEPVEKQMCSWKRQLYEVGSQLEINGKTYICTMIDPPDGYLRWALAPVQ